MSKVGSPLINWILRAFQVLFGIVVLGLSVTLIRAHHVGSLPSSLGFSAFIGGMSILAALVGIAAVWLEFLDGIVGLAVDALVAVLNIAGGILLAIKLDGVKCQYTNKFGSVNDVKLSINEIFTGGCEVVKEVTECYVYAKYDNQIGKLQSYIEGHCRETQAAMVFMFMTAVLLVASALMGFLKRRKGY